MKTRWRCTICGQIFEGEVPPAPCPVCGAGADAFERLAPAAPQRWKCTVCGAIFEGSVPPVPCPVCGAGADAFVPVDGEAGAAETHDTDSRFLIVGGGAAAVSAAEEIRRRDRTAQVTMICGEGVLPYNRPAISDAVADGYSLASITLHDGDWYEENRIGLILNARAERIDVQGRSLTLSDGRVLPYTKLLLATGAQCFCPVKPAEGGCPVLVLRCWKDARRLMDSARPGSRAVVAGGGILGLEAALALRTRGAEVLVAELSDRILNIQADPFVSGALQKKLEARGLSFRTKTSVAGVTADGAVLSDGTTVPADFIVVSAGIRSELSLARQAGIACERGILVDEQMRTNQPDIFAAGDCAQFGGRVAGLWGAALSMGGAAGASMCGFGGSWTPPLPATAFEAEGIHLFAAGCVNGEGLRTVVLRDDAAGEYEKLAFRNGRLTGVLMFGRVHDGAAALSAAERGVSQAEALRLLG